MTNQTKGKATVTTKQAHLPADAKETPVYLSEIRDQVVEEFEVVNPVEGGKGQSGTKFFRIMTGLTLENGTKRFLCAGRDANGNPCGRTYSTWGKVRIHYGYAHNPDRLRKRLDEYNQQRQQPKRSRANGPSEAPQAHSQQASPAAQASERTGEPEAPATPDAGRGGAAMNKLKALLSKAEECDQWRIMAEQNQAELLALKEKNGRLSREVESLSNELEFYRELEIDIEALQL